MRPRLSPLFTALGLGVILLVGCGPEFDETLRESRGALAHPGPWEIPESTRAIGDTQYVENTQAGPWIGEEGCYGSFTPGAAIVEDYLYEHFPQISYIGGYSCRAINGDPTTMSVHATGRALDLMIPLDGGEADNDMGDPVGNFLIENAQAMGIQYIIWDRWTWNGSRPAGSKDRLYTGAHDHHDHLHIEVSVEASEHTEIWFDGIVTPPAIEGCDPIPPDGAIVDDTSPCFRALGPAEYWRVAQGAGYGDSVHWTNAYEDDAPSNWARWSLTFNEAGNYGVEVYLDPAYAVASGVRYEVRFGGETNAVYIDQASASEWVPLGTFAFAQGASQHLSVYDNMPQPVPDDQHIAADAIRLTGEGKPPITPVVPDPPPPPPPETSPPPRAAAGDDEGCGCRTVRGAGSGAGAAGWAVLLLSVGWRQRRASCTRRTTADGT